MIKNSVTSLAISALAMFGVSAVALADQFVVLDCAGQETLVEQISDGERRSLEVVVQNVKGEPASGVMVKAVGADRSAEAVATSGKAVIEGLSAGRWTVCAADQQSSVVRVALVSKSTGSMAGVAAGIAGVGVVGGGIALAVNANDSDSDGGEPMSPTLQAPVEDLPTAAAPIADNKPLPPISIEKPVSCSKKVIAAAVEEQERCGEVAPISLFE